MNGTRRLMGGVVVGIWLAILGAASPAHAQYFGNIQAAENFPDMLETRGGCNKVYQDYLATAHRIESCDNLADAKAELAIQDAIADQAGTIKKCKKCQDIMGHAREAAEAYKEQINIYAKKCSDPDKTAELKGDLPAKEREVCRMCDNKWPGKLGPAAGSPCKKK